jgi:hypothetical protein
VGDEFVENVLVAVRDGNGGHAFVARRLANWQSHVHTKTNKTKKSNNMMRCKHSVMNTITLEIRALFFFENKSERK